MVSNRTKAANDRRGAPSVAAEELGDIRKKLDEIRKTLRGLGAPESAGAQPAPQPVSAAAEEPEIAGEVARLVEQIRQRTEGPSAAPQAAAPVTDEIWETGNLAAAIQQIEVRRAALEAEPRSPQPASARPASAIQDDPWPVLQRMEGRLEQLGAMMERSAAPAAETDAFKLLSEHTARIEALLGDSPKTPQLRSLQTQIRSLGTRLEEVARATPSPDAFATLEASVLDIGHLLADGFPAGGFRGLTAQLGQFDERVKTLEAQDGSQTLERQIAEIHEILRQDDRTERLGQVERGFEGLQIRVAGIAETAADRSAVEQLAGRLDQVSARVEQHSLQPIEQALAGLSQSAAADRATVQQLATRIEEVSGRLDERSLKPVEEAIEALQGRLDGLATLFETSALGSADRENVRQIESRMGVFETRLDRVETLVPSPGAVAALEARLEEISRAIAERPQAPEDPAVGRLERQLAELAARVEAVGSGGTTARPLQDLEAQIARLGTQIEANETRYGALGELDGTIESLMKVVDRSREEATALAREAAAEAVKAAMVQQGRDDNPQTDVAIEALRESLQELHKAAQASETRRLDALGGLQDSLSRIVDRLGALERELGQDGSGAPALSSRQIGAEARRAAAPERERPSDTRPEGFTLQAAMAGFRSPAEPAEDAGSTRADFIAAARRAARHAVEPAADGSDRQEDAGEAEGARRAGRLKSLLQQKRRSIALATAAILLVIGTLQLQGLLGDRLGTAVAGLDKALVAAAPAPSSVQPNPALAAIAAIAADARRSPSLTPEVTFSAPSAAPARFEMAEAPAVAPVAVEAPSALVGSELLRNAAARGDARAQYEIGVRYTDGKVVARDLAEAARWYQYAAEQGLAPAQYRLGNLLEKGMGRPKDVAAAKGWYEKAAQAGNKMAMHNLGVLFAEGSGGKPDYATAIGWFRQAADHGVRDSQFNLGVIYARGLGAAQDLVESYKWFAVLSTAGDPEATRKRDEVASRLSAEQREQARMGADAFRGKTPIAEANDVAAPEGGWDPQPKPDVVSGLQSLRQGGLTQVAMAGVKTERLLTQQVQALLVERGFDPGPSDGVPGRKTRDAVRAFERANGQPETGQITPDLFYKLAAI